MSFAFANMGQYYLYGHGVKKDHNKAFEWLKKGCEAGATGIYAVFLGYCYEEGLDVGMDLKEAMKYYMVS